LRAERRAPVEEPVPVLASGVVRRAPVPGGRGGPSAAAERRTVTL